MIKTLHLNCHWLWTYYAGSNGHACLPRMYLILLFTNTWFTPSREARKESSGIQRFDVLVSWHNKAGLWGWSRWDYPAKKLWDPIKLKEQKFIMATRCWATKQKCFFWFIVQSWNFSHVICLQSDGKLPEFLPVEQAVPSHRTKFLRGQHKFSNCKV